MIVQKRYYVGDREFIRTASDAGRYVVRDGISYREAYDPAEFGRQYTEGDEMEDISPEDAALTRYANELTGAADETITDATETLIKIVKEGI